MPSVDLRLTSRTRESCSKLVKLGEINGLDFVESVHELRRLGE